MVTGLWSSLAVAALWFEGVGTMIDRCKSVREGSWYLDFKSLQR